jgi:hypothetical protein
MRTHMLETLMASAVLLAANAIWLIGGFSQ